MKIPDFFIIGASKCGTTALSYYLSQHPNICFSRTKEPHYFSEDFPALRLDTTSEQYWRRNFSHYDPKRHLMIGEGSGTYYISDVAIPNILRANPEAKFIYMVRDPVDMIVSWHQAAQFMRNDGMSLETAWNTLPEYRRLSALGSRLEIIKAIVPTGQLMVIILDGNMKQMYEAVLRFLDLPPDNRTEFPKINEAKAPRSKALSFLYRSTPKWAYNLSRELKLMLGISGSINPIAALNTKKAEAMELSPSFKERLTRELASEKRLLKIE